MDNSLYFAAKDDGCIDGMTHLLSCRKCKRKIMVSIYLMGTIHHAGTAVECAECVEIKDDFKKEFPKECLIIETWINGSSDLEIEEMTNKIHEERYKAIEIADAKWLEENKK